MTPKRPGTALPPPALRVIWALPKRDWVNRRLWRQTCKISAGAYLEAMEQVSDPTIDTVIDRLRQLSADQRALACEVTVSVIEDIRFQAELDADPTYKAELEASLIAASGDARVTGTKSQAEVEAWFEQKLLARHG